MEYYKGFGYLKLFKFAQQIDCCFKKKNQWHAKTISKANHDTCLFNEKSFCHDYLEIAFSTCTKTYSLP